MATAPVYLDTPTLVGSVISATAYGGTKTAPTGTTTIYTGGTADLHQVRRIDIKGLGTSVIGLLDFWLYNGTTYYLQPYSQTIIALTGSTVQDPFSASIVFGDGNRSLILPAAATAWTIVAGFSVTQTTAAIATVHGTAL